MLKIMTDPAQRRVIEKLLLEPLASRTMKQASVSSADQGGGKQGFYWIQVRR